MKPVDQTRFYNKDAGTHGNCQQAATASIFDLPLDAVPNFMDFQGEGLPGFWQKFWEFVRSLGYEPYERHTHNGAVPYFEGYYLAYGPSSRGVSHAVVYRAGKLAHDPHPSREGIKEVETICLFVPLDPARMRLT